jgi:amino acid transporter
MSDDSLKRDVLGTWAVVFLVVSAAAPLNLIAGYGPLGYLAGGIGAPAGFLLAGLVLALFVVGFMAMTRYVDRPGTFYAYIESGLGSRLGQGAAAVALFGYLAVQVSGTGVLSTVAQSLFENLFGLHLHWAVYGAVTVMLVWYLGRRGIDIGAKVLAVLLAAEVGILTIIAAAVIVQGGADGPTFGSFAPSNVFTGGMAAASVVWFGAFVGIEYTAVYRTETRRPERTMPRAAVISLAFLALFYCVVAWAVIQAFGEMNLAAAAGEHHTDMFFVVADQYLGPWASDLTQILMVTSSIASALAYFNTISRYGHAMAHDGLLPAQFGRVHPVHRSPTLPGNAQALIGLGAVAFFVVAGLDPYEHMAVWFSTPGILSLIMMMALTSVAVVVFFSKRLPEQRPARWVIGSAVLASVLLTAVTYLLIANIELMTAATGPINVVLGSAPFLVLLLGVLARLRRRSPREAAAPVAADPDLAPAQHHADRTADN